MTGSGDFDFERLEVHEVALQLMPVLRAIGAQFPVGFADLRNHMLGSGRSIHLNIAEGSGKTRPGSKRERYETARGSASECASAVEEARLLKLADRKLLDQARSLLSRISAMLTRLIIRWED